jgi:hypothetical protein
MANFIPSRTRPCVLYSTDPAGRAAGTDTEQYTVYAKALVSRRERNKRAGSPAQVPTRRAEASVAWHVVCGSGSPAIKARGKLGWVDSPPLHFCLCYH